ncbi:ACT domain-containing protein [Paenibacillus yanchengensis]|uniref:UPF0735 ACT domain-containing protein ACFSJH_12095 n=1 Tax=Paenibacillus yanchengensis TaxID=2035833 RepID=A0ABW4YLY2_9BACL
MTERYFVVREDMLPEAIAKTIQVKELLHRGIAATVHEAAERVGISRSAFYKYKDGVYPLTELPKERIVTIAMDLEHRSGVLSPVLALVAGQQGSILTMNQSIPLQGYANVVISVDISEMDIDVSELIRLLHQQQGVRSAIIVGQG